MTRRPQGSGSIYQRQRDGMWCASVELGGTPRRRKVVTATTREALLERLASVGIDPNPPARPRRPDHMTKARALGTHTEAEWSAICRVTKTCRYCGVQLNIFNDAKDHQLPVSRGGSDGPENLERICWECNLAKGDRIPEEYAYTGLYPRDFAPSPLKRAAYMRVIARRDGSA